MVWMSAFSNQHLEINIIRSVQVELAILQAVVARA